MVKTLVTLLALLFASAPFAAEDDRLPDHRAAEATGDIVQSWLIRPTDRYRHFVLGAPYEAAGVRVRLADGTLRDFILSEDAVFEDREPRIVDLDGDGRNEVVLVKSALGLGASLAVLGLRGGELRIVAETAPIGRANRWLNPAGFGRFTRQGGLQIALVRMPHLLGRLEIWELEGDDLVLVRVLDGFSNHRIGSNRQRLSAVLQRGPGEADLLLIPRMDRRSLALMDLSQRKPLVAEVQLSAPVDGDIRIRCIGKEWNAVVPLANDRGDAVVQLPEPACQR